MAAQYSSDASLPSAGSTGRLGIKYLQRFWARIRKDTGSTTQYEPNADEQITDQQLLHTLGLGTAETLRYLYFEKPDFSQFEDWIVAVNNGILNEAAIRSFNVWIDNKSNDLFEQVMPGRVLDEKMWQCWQSNGYVVVPGVISTEDCRQTVALINQTIGADPANPATWYDTTSREGIMVPLFRHPLVDKNRHAPVVRMAFEEIWGRNKLVVNTDKTGFNPPDHTGAPMPVMRLHWDTSLAQPVPFGTQGLIYLSDTTAAHGALRLVPGFHLQIENWLNNLSPEQDPRQEDLEALGAMAVPGQAGDLLIWHHALPHAAGVNRADSPRYVQYLNYAPATALTHPVWK